MRQMFMGCCYGRPIESNQIPELAALMLLALSGSEGGQRIKRYFINGESATAPSSLSFDTNRGILRRAEEPVNDHLRRFRIFDRIFWRFQKWDLSTSHSVTEIRRRFIHQSSSAKFLFKNERFYLWTFLVFCFTTGLIGCAAHTGVIPLGKETFMIAKQQATGFPGLGNIKAEIIVEGSRHCNSIGKEFQIVSTNETLPPYVLGNYPRSEITFMCLSPGDADLQRPKLQKTPDAVVEFRKL